VARQKDRENLIRFHPDAFGQKLSSYRNKDSGILIPAEEIMLAITGITGNVGGKVARNLLAEGLKVRAVIRDATKSAHWEQLGCEVALADINDAKAMARAFDGVEGVFILVPPHFDPAPGFPEARSIAASLRSALEIARPGRAVYLSTIGAQAKETNLLTQHTLIEQELNALPVPIAFLRPGWFIENAAWDVAPAREKGVVPSFLRPLDKPVPMVATADIARVAAELLRETWDGSRVVELEGPHRVTPNEIAAAFAKLLRHAVRMEVVPRESWEPLFTAQGMKNPGPRIRMLDGFNEGWIEFESGEAGSRKGNVELETVLKGLIERA
jgi:NAD(P)H dehydrogenase (quinone)